MCTSDQAEFGFLLKIFENYIEFELHMAEKKKTDLIIKLGLL